MRCATSRRAWWLAGLSGLLLLAAGGCGQLPVGPLVPPALTIRGPALGFPATQLLFVSREIGYALAVEHHPGSDTGPLDVYRTKDGGRSWSRVFQTPLTTGAPVQLREIGASQIALVGLAGAAYVAPVAGGPWRRVQLPGQTVGAGSVSFATPTVWYVLGDIMGYAGQDFAMLYRSGDAGATWHRVRQINGPPMTGISFSHSDSGWVGMGPAVGGVVVLARAGSGTPAGRIPLDRTPLLKFELEAEPPVFFTADEGVLPIVTGTIPPMTWLTTTRNGGANWSVPVRLPGTGTVYAFTDAEHFWAAGGKGLWRSSDGGRKWAATTLPQGYSVTALDFTTPRTGWALVQHGGRVWVISTHDGGRHWSGV